MNSIVLTYCSLERTHIPLFSCHYDNIKIAYIIADGILSSAAGFKLVLLLHYYNLFYEYGFLN
jgi:hypothetical protein